MTGPSAREYRMGARFPGMQWYLHFCARRDAAVVEAVVNWRNAKFLVAPLVLRFKWDVTAVGIEWWVFSKFCTFLL